MAAVAGIALQFGDGTVLGLVSFNRPFRFPMTRETEATRLLFHKLAIVSTVRSVTVQTIAVRKRQMRRLPRHIRGQVLMAGQAEFPFAQTLLEQSAPFAAVGIVTGTALTPAKGLVRYHAAHLHPGLFVAGKTEGRLGLGQQTLQCRVVGGMAVSAAAFLGRGVNLRTVGIGLRIVAGITERRGRLIEQRLFC